MKIIAFIIILLLACSICFAAGFAFGVEKGIKLVVSYGINLFELDIDADVLAKGIYQYKNNINSCLFTQDSLFTENASIHINQRD